ncbi:class I SAM-dependent methyltransferase [Desulfovibrio sp. 86]|uniref:Methyltransferase type 11 n=1 Tax=uncultured Desulfovibrio sp. TaxID=167968 RepID=A0A212L969_9BACT|nr:class I SAM-dependent methyltransferase [Desulfovibrio sp. 86]SCM74027.1 Methyltransferase type 11 [uncultured Desulfovibrio sp.]VZH34593.1 Methyltransferase type 11 [Desulfovibrio sp. 86]
MNSHNTVEKGEAFTGMRAGKHYERMARIFGLNEDFYKRAVGDLRLEDGMKALDMGCGTGALSFALAHRSSPRCTIHGVDLSEDQTIYASNRPGGQGGALHFSTASMDEALFPDGALDLAMTSLALHEASPEVRRAALSNIARMLKPGGKFLLVDVAKPQLRGWGLVLRPLMALTEKFRDNRENSYADICAKLGLIQIADQYINVIIRRQVFVKPA